MTHPADTRASSNSLSTDLIRWAGSRRGLLLQGTILNALVLVLLWLALYLVVGATCMAIANALPGVTPFEPPTAPAAFLVLSIGLMLTVAVIVSARMRNVPRSRRRRRIIARTRTLLVRLLHDVLGLVPIGRRPLLAAILLGFAGALVALVVAYLVSLVPGLADTVPASDARYDAVAMTPRWVAPVFFAIYAPAAEELIYRGMLLAVCAIAAVTIRSRSIRIIVVITALLSSSFLFGIVHLHWSLANAAAAAATGLIYGTIAVLVRSLWAPIIAHALYNALIFLL